MDHILQIIDPDPVHGVAESANARQNHLIRLPDPVPVPCQDSLLSKELQGIFNTFYIAGFIIDQSYHKALHLSFTSLKRSIAILEIHFNILTGFPSPSLPEGTCTVKLLLFLLLCPIQEAQGC
jgi:hypothetical protein